MTIGEVLAQLEAQKPNTATQAQKLQWLNQVEWDALEQVYGPERSFSPYWEGTDPATQLLLPEPHSQAYVYFLAAQIDFWNREYGGYNAHMALYNRHMRRFAAQWLAEHPPARGGFAL